MPKSLLDIATGVLGIETGKKLGDSLDDYITDKQKEFEDNKKEVAIIDIKRSENCIYVKVDFDMYSEWYSCKKHLFPSKYIDRKITIGELKKMLKIMRSYNGLGFEVYNHSFNSEGHYCYTSKKQYNNNVKETMLIDKLFKADNDRYKAETNSWKKKQKEKNASASNESGANVGRILSIILGVLLCFTGVGAILGIFLIILGLLVEPKINE